MWNMIACSRSSQTKVFKIGSHCFSAKQVVLRRKARICLYSFLSFVPIVTMFVFCIDLSIWRVKSIFNRFLYLVLLLYFPTTVPGNLKKEGVEGSQTCLTRPHTLCTRPKPRTCSPVVVVVLNVICYSFCVVTL